jgi:ElaB/YqjD/DUF883 family membrane-anchored ribosome-binding protein
MSQTLAEKVGDHIAESVREATRATTEVKDAVADGLHAAKRSAQHGYDAAGKCVDESAHRIQQNPLFAVAASMAAGVAIGLLAGLSLRRK